MEWKREDIHFNQIFHKWIDKMFLDRIHSHDIHRLCWTILDISLIQSNFFLRASSMYYMCVLPLLKFQFRSTYTFIFPRKTYVCTHCKRWISLQTRSNEHEKNGERNAHRKWRQNIEKFISTTIRNINKENSQASRDFRMWNEWRQHEHNHMCNGSSYTASIQYHFNMDSFNQTQQQQIEENI